MWQRIIEAWSASRFERTGIDELIMYGPLILLVVAVFLIVAGRTK
jgi:hypothetical protein